MRLGAISVALLFCLRAAAQTVDGGVPADYGCPQAADELVALDGGYFISEARAKRLACLLTATEKERDLLAAQGPNVSLGPWWTIALGVLVGGAAVFTVCKQTHGCK